MNHALLLSAKAKPARGGGGYPGLKPLGCTPTNPAGDNQPFPTVAGQRRTLRLTKSNYRLPLDDLRVRARGHLGPKCLVSPTIFG